MYENAEYICFLYNLHKDLYKNDLFFLEFTQKSLPLLPQIWNKEE